MGSGCLEQDLGKTGEGCGLNNSPQRFMDRVFAAVIMLRALDGRASWRTLCHHLCRGGRRKFQTEERPLREAESKEKMFCHFEDGGRAMTQNMLLYLLEKAKHRLP